MVTPMDDIILRADQVTKAYPGTVALKGVDFNIYRGKVNVLVGENGAGKSTLMKILAGVEQVTSGKLLLEGKEISPKNPREAEALGIGIIYQELNLFPNLNVAENIFTAHELTNRGIFIKHGEQEKHAAELLARLEQPINPRTLVADLRIGHQQIVEIAKVLALDVQILIMDEPTSALSGTEVEILFRVINELKAQGVSIVYISHKLDELLEIGDYITVLRDGNRIAEAQMAAVDLLWIVEHMVGRDTHAVYTPAPRDIGGEILRVENLCLQQAGNGRSYTLNEVSFSLHAGEILGIYGLMGAGRTELFETLMGLHPHATGHVWLDDCLIDGKAITERIRAGIMLIPEDRQREGLVQSLSVANNMILASLQNYLSRLRYLSAGKERDKVNRQIKDLAIKVANPFNLISSLSGGNQQKVVVGKALLTSPKVLLMDEPTRGIDVGAKEEIFNIMTDLAQRGLGVLFVSTELKEVMAMADRILVIARGRITAEFRRSEATQQALVEASAIDHEFQSINKSLWVRKKGSEGMSSDLAGKRAEPQREQHPQRTALRTLLFQLRAFIALLLIFSFFSIYSHSFLQTGNLIILTKQVAINAVLGIGMTFVILAGGIDLSVGSIVGLSGMIVGGLINEGLSLPVFGVVVYFNVWIVMLIALVAGMLIGLANGIIITRFNVAPFIATLGMLYIARGFALLRNNGATFPNLVGDPALGNTGFPLLGTGTLFGLPYSIWIMVVMGAVAVFLTSKTPFGRQVYALGGNERAALLSGVRVKTVKMMTYVISGFCSALVGLIITSQLVSSHPATGTSFELNAIAAVVLGGTSLSGGRGTIGGTIIGAFVIGVLNNGMIIEGVSSFWQTVITGVVIIIAVIIDQVQQKLQERSVA